MEDNDLQCEDLINFMENIAEMRWLEDLNLDFRKNMIGVKGV